MAHHKRRSRRKDKRDLYPCGCCIKPEKGDKGSPQISENEVCNGFPRKKKDRPKKDKCPAAKAHEWYKEAVTKEDYWRGEYTFERWTCIHCWKEKIPNTRGDIWRRRRRRYSNARYRSYKLQLPKREVDLY
jgi:hypothetical protein